MLTQQAKHFLELLKTESRDDIDTFTLDNFKTFFPDFTQDEFLSMVDDLNGNGFLTHDIFQDGSLCISLTHKGKNYLEVIANEIQSPLQQTFNIGTVQNSAFGNTGPVTLSNGPSFCEILELIRSQDIPEKDRAALQELTIYVQSLIENEAPAKKGCLSKFGGLLKDYGEICCTIFNTFKGYFFNPLL